MVVCIEVFPICTSYSSNTTCAAQNGCQWMSTHDIIPIANRAATPVNYGDRYYCKQCPEQCRIDDYQGTCGVENNGNNVFVDCSLGYCPSNCRVAEPLEPTNPECKAYPENAGKACKECPALCRRKSDFSSADPSCQAIDGCMMGSDPSTGCIDECAQENPPEKACQGCME